MTNKIIAAVGVWAGCIGLYFMNPAAADPQTLPNYTSGSSVQRTEHLGLRVDTSRCVFMQPGTTVDAGAFLSSPPDAATIGAGDARPAMGPPVPPSAELSYVCVSQDNASCLGQKASPFSCLGAFVIPADSMTAPIMFLPEPDGGAPKVMAISASGTASLTCCPVIPVVNRAR